MIDKEPNMTDQLAWSTPFPNPEITIRSHVLPLVTQEVVAETLADVQRDKEKYIPSAFSTLIAENKLLARKIDTTVEMLADGDKRQLGYLSIISIVTYDMLRNQAQSDHVKLPKVTQSTISAISEQLKKPDSMFVADTLQIFLAENPFLLKNAVEMIKRVGQQPDMRGDTQLLLAVIYGSLKQQAEIDRMAVGH